MAFAVLAFVSLSTTTYAQQANNTQESTVIVKKTAKKVVKKEMQGPKNAGKILPIASEFKFTPISISPADLQLLKSERYTASMILAAAGIPIELVGGIAEGNKTYSNYEHAQFDFYTNTIPFTDPCGPLVVELYDFTSHVETPLD